MARVENPHIFDSRLQINDSYDCLVGGIPIARHFDHLVKDKRTSPFNEYFDDVVIELLRKQDISKDPVIIDFGCGNGKTLDRLGREIFPRPKRLIGLDKSEEMVSIAKENFPLLEIHKSDMRNVFNGKVQIADIITSINAVHYLPSLDDVLKTYAGAYRLLKPGGIFVLATGDHESTFGYRKMDEVKAKEWIENGRKPMDWSMPDENRNPVFRLRFYPYLNEEHQEALEEAGFSSIKIYRQYLPQSKIAELNPNVYKLLESNCIFVFFTAIKPHAEE